MASGHVNRTQRPNTWLHRPSLRREDSPCQLGAVHTWPIATCGPETLIGRFRGHSGHGRTCCWLNPVANDPNRRFATVIYRIAKRLGTGCQLLSLAGRPSTAGPIPLSKIGDATIKQKAADNAGTLNFSKGLFCDEWGSDRSAGPTEAIVDAQEDLFHTLLDAGSVGVTSDYSYARQV